MSVIVLWVFLGEEHLYCWVNSCDFYRISQALFPSVHIITVTLLKILI